jgi:hypothetical protein
MSLLAVALTLAEGAHGCLRAATGAAVAAGRIDPRLAYFLRRSRLAFLAGETKQAYAKDYRLFCTPGHEGRRRHDQATTYNTANDDGLPAWTVHRTRTVYDGAPSVRVDLADVTAPDGTSGWSRSIRQNSIRSSSTAATAPRGPGPAQGPPRIREPRHRSRDHGLTKITGLALTAAPMS